MFSSWFNVKSDQFQAMEIIFKFKLIGVFLFVIFDIALLAIGCSGVWYVEVDDTEVMK